MVDSWVASVRCAAMRRLARALIFDWAFGAVLGAALFQILSTPARNDA